MKAYSTDLRKRIIKAWQTGQSQARIADRYEVSLSTVKRVIRQYRREGHVEPKLCGAWARQLGTPAELAELEAQLAAHPDSTIQHHCELWAQTHHQRISYTTMWRAIQRVKWTRKKR